MKKLLVVLVIFSNICFTSCGFLSHADIDKFITLGFSLERSGLDEFRAAECTYGLNVNLLPSEDFISEFVYTSGDYQYYDRGLNNGWGFVTSIVYLKYEPEIYAEAKMYCTETFILDGDHKFEYNGYSFIENITYFSNTSSDDPESEKQKNHYYPSKFNMFGFNDEKCTLIFLGYYNGDPKEQDKQLALTDFGAFWELYFSEYHNIG